MPPPSQKRKDIDNMGGDAGDGRSLGEMQILWSSVAVGGLGAAQFKLHNSDRSVKEISSAEGAAPLSYRT